MDIGDEMHLQPLTSQDHHAWAELVAICFDKPYTHMVSLLNWLNRFGSMVAYGMWDNNRLVAQYACLERRVVASDHTIPIGMSMNMAVHPDYRGQGLIKQVSRPVYDTLRERDIILGMGFSNADGVKVDKRSKGYGYRVVGQMQPYVALTRQSHSPTVRLTTSFPQEQTKHNQNASTLKHFAKTWDYVINRYACHPFRQYHYGVWTENHKIRGIVIYKPVILWRLTGVALLDVFSDDATELLKRWSYTLHKNGIYLIHTLVSPNSSVRHILSDTHIKLRLPITRNPYYLTVKPLVDYQPTILDFDTWDLIGGDIL